MRLGFATALVITLCAIALGWAQESKATTHISSTTYTSNTTWNTSGSPYVLDGDVTVSSGVTLTVDAGVIVKFNGWLRSLTVHGTIDVNGTSGSHVIFTSLQDDAHGGDTGGDGSTSGAAGQWYMIDLSTSTTTSAFDYADVLYGGSGGFPYATNGAVKLSSTGSATFTHVHISSSASAGLLVGSGTAGPTTYPEADVSYSTFENSKIGISVNQGIIDVTHSHLVTNDRDGLSFNLTNEYAGAASSIQNSEIAMNARYGVALGLDPAIADSSLPAGNYNNIYANDDSSTYPRQLDAYSIYYDAYWASDWTDNYWSSRDDGISDVTQWAQSPSCVVFGGAGHLAYGWAPEPSNGEPAEGPVTFSTEVINTPPPNPPIYCGFDYVTTIPFSSSPNSV